jgi:hypothetical protein
MFKTGDQVKFVPPVISGAVVGASVDAESNFLLLVEFVDAEGVTQQRYFKSEELQAVE